jgi:O-antigen/teichoic acid export membrane protein
LLSFSKWAFLQNLCAAADLQAPSLILGRMVGVQAVGLYNVAYQISSAPVTELAVPIRQPIYSGYAKVRHDIESLRQQFLSGFSLLFALLLPLSLGIALVAPEIERIALGPAWDGVALVIALCAIFTLGDALAHFNGNVFSVLGLYARQTAISAALVVVRVPALVVGAVMGGLDGVAFALAGTALLNALIWNWQTGRLLDLGLASFSSELWRSCVAALVMVLAVSAARALLPMDTSLLGSLLHLAVLAVWGAMVHVSTQWVLWYLAGSPLGAETQIARTVAKGLERLVRSGRRA